MNWKVPPVRDRRYAPKTSDEIHEALATNTGPGKTSRCKHCGSTTVEWITYEKQAPNGVVGTAWLLVEAGPNGQLQRHICKQAAAYYSNLRQQKQAALDAETVGKATFVDDILAEETSTPSKNMKVIIPFTPSKA
jgi:hypothetical protein